MNVWGTVGGRYLSGYCAFRLSFFSHHWSPNSYSSIYHRRCLIFVTDSFANQHFISTLAVRDGQNKHFSVHGETVIQGQEFYIHGSVHRESNLIISPIICDLYFNHPPLIYIYIFVKASNIQYDQSRILNYTLILKAAYFTRCS